MAATVQLLPRKESCFNAFEELQVFRDTIQGSVNADGISTKRSTIFMKSSGFDVM